MKIIKDIIVYCVIIFFAIALMWDRNLLIVLYAALGTVLIMLFLSRYFRFKNYKKIKPIAVIIKSVSFILSVLILSVYLFVPNSYDSVLFILFMIFLIAGIALAIINIFNSYDPETAGIIEGKKSEEISEEALIKLDRKVKMSYVFLVIGTAILILFRLFEISTFISWVTLMPLLAALLYYIIILPEGRMKYIYKNWKMMRE